MAKFSPADSGYVEVKDRIESFYAKHPEGAIRTNIFSMDENLVVVGAEVFADKNDEHPIGTGFSQMQIPGSTPFTKDSELENAETSAVGRAIAMAGFEVHKSVASREEIDMKARPVKTADPLRKEVRAAAEELYGPEWKKGLKEDYGLSVTSRDSESELDAALLGMQQVLDAKEATDAVPF